MRRRRYEELLENEKLLEITKVLLSFGVVMDLAKSYHNFAKEVFPNAIHIVDRFHAILKRISKTLSTYQTKFLKE